MVLQPLWYMTICQCPKGASRDWKYTVKLPHMGEKKRRASQHSDNLEEKTLGEKVKNVQNVIKQVLKSSLSLLKGKSKTVNAQKSLGRMTFMII